MKKIIIWGAGERTYNCIERNFFDGYEILAIIDSYSNIEEVYGIRVVRPDKISDYKNIADYVVVCNRFFPEIIPLIIELGVPQEKIVIIDNYVGEPFGRYYLKTKDLFPAIYEITRNYTMSIVKNNEKDFLDEYTIYNNPEFRDIEYRHDYFRYRTFEFVSEIINRNNIHGAVAELGVFRGMFAALINYRFPERKIYLFDTFEGFDEKEGAKEIANGRCDQNFLNVHKDTSVERMLNNLSHPEMAIVCKGLFPDSVTCEAENETYVFVSLDVDFEDSTYEGLRFFYPRLAEGGYIFIHDYNTFYLGGIRAAVEKYEKLIGNKLKVVPIADRAGTLVVVK